ncbi:MAG: phosphatase PAP2 family protein [Acidobacteriota bacterium]
MRRNVLRYCLFSIIQLAVMFSAGLAGRAQTPPTPSATPAVRKAPSLEREFFKNILRDQKAIWTAPLRVHRGDAKWMVPSGIGLMALFTTDRITGDKISEFNRLVKPSKIISQAGSTYSVGAVAATFYFIGRKRNDARARETGMLTAEAFVDTLIVVHALKGITQRGRPRTGPERSEFFDGGDSFPSGHSIQVWSVATIIANEYRDHRAVQIAAYGVASAVSVARFTGGKHYLSDVLAGSALGYGIGKYIYHAHHRKKSYSSHDDEGVSESRQLVIAPQYNRRARQYGAALTWSF